MKKLVIYGLSNPVIIKLIEAINKDKKIFDLMGLIRFPDNNPADDVLGYPVLGTEELIADLIEIMTSIFSIMLIILRLI